jgi:DNA-binding response OmpR family regulator
MKNGLLKVLLAEDVAADAELCIDALEKAGFSVCADVCSRAEDFEQLIGATAYDVVLADYNLKDCTGRRNCAAPGEEQSRHCSDWKLRG